MYGRAESKVASLCAPILVLQGDQDSSAFVNNAKRVQELSLRYDKDCELVMYAGAGHQFDLFESGSAAARCLDEDARVFGSSLEFFNYEPKETRTAPSKIMAPQVVPINRENLQSRLVGINSQ
jgi:hypothetical protein